MRRIFFKKVEEDGIEYVYKNYRLFKGRVIFNRNGKCSKYPAKKRVDDDNQQHA